MPRRLRKRSAAATCVLCPIKTDDQLDLQALHRVRDRLVHRRTAVINQIRGFLLERGITFAQGPVNLRRHMPAILEDAEQNITPRMRNLLHTLWQEWKSLNTDIDCVSEDIERICNKDEACRNFGRKISKFDAAKVRERNLCVQLPPPARELAPAF